MNCLFCAIAAGEIPSAKVYEDEQVYAFKDIAPQGGVGGVDQCGYRLFTNGGPDAGQSVPHLHLHLIGGKPLKWDN